jgi:hypothetical protein
MSDSHNATLLGWIVYYAMTGNSSSMPDQASITGDYWIAIANPQNGTHFTNFLVLNDAYHASYYTYTLQNASVITNITFANRTPTIQATDIQELEFFKSILHSISRQFKAISRSLSILKVAFPRICLLLVFVLRLIESIN